MSNDHVYVELKKSRLPVPQRWRFRVKALNGRILASSETYHNRADVMDAINLLFGFGNVEIRES